MKSNITVAAIVSVLASLVTAWCLSAWFSAEMSDVSERISQLEKFFTKDGKLVLQGDNGYRSEISPRTLVIGSIDGRSAELGFFGDKPAVTISDRHGLRYIVAADSRGGCSMELRSDGYYTRLATTKTGTNFETANTNASAQSLQLKMGEEVLTAAWEYNSKKKTVAFGLRALRQDGVFKLRAVGEKQDGTQSSFENR